MRVFFSDFSYATIGMDFKMKFIDVNGISTNSDTGFVIYILLLIFDYFLIMLFTDTASQERFWSENFRNVNESLFRGADIIIVGYDITDRHSLYRCED